MEKNIDLPRMLREAKVRAQSFEEKDNTVDVVWTTGAKVRRRSWMDGIYDEELIVSGSTVRLERLNAGAPFLNTHDAYDLSGVIGSIVPGSARIERGKGVAKVRLSSTEEDQGIVKKIVEGIITNISVGYRSHKVEKTEGEEGDVPLWRVVDWEPLEISAVPVPADPGAQIRGVSDNKFSCILVSPDFDASAAQARMRMRLSQFRAA